MEQLLNLGEGTWRFIIFASVLVVMAALEGLFPKRELTQSKARRWITNIAFGGLGSLTARLMAALSVPLAAIAAALWAEANGVGLFNLTAWPSAIEILIAIVVLDLAIYLQHVALHKISLLWRLHKVHHSDRDIDVTTAVRFHPIEIALSMLWKIVVVLCLGASAFAVFLFEVILNACAMFNHSNVRLPSILDAILRTFIVTPDMHRVHHSVIHQETDSNYGFNLSIWDRLFGTYTPQPQKGHEGMTIGLNEYQTKDPTRLIWSLALPFTKTGKEMNKSQTKAGAKTPAKNQTAGT